MLKSAVVILNWNGEGYLRRYLPSVIKYTNRSLSVIYVADNGSEDGSADLVRRQFPEVEYLQLDRNYGFAEGYNRALSQIQAEYFVLLNSDVEVTSGWLEPLIELLDKNPLSAACMPKILSDDRRDLFEYAGAAGGFIDRFGYPFCRGRIFDCLEQDYGQYDNPVEIFWATGACMAIRGKLFNLCGGFDKDFFAHMEEIDLCWRLRNRGYSIKVEPSSVVYHLGGGTLAQGNPRKTYLNFRNNLWVLYKNLPDNKLFSVIFLRLLLDGLSACRFLLKGHSGDFNAVFRAHRDFYRSAGRYRKFRRSERKFITRYDHREIYPGSIVVQYFIRKRITFRKLGWLLRGNASNE